MHSSCAIHLPWFAMGRPFGPRGFGPFGHHGPPPWVHEMFGGPAGRAERGEVRYLVLDSLKEGPKHGYEIIQSLEKRTNGQYRPSPGTIYPTLQLLEELGHVRCDPAENNRKIFTITDEGLAELAQHQQEVDEAFERWSGAGVDWPEDKEFFSEVARRVRRMVHAVMGGLRRGRLNMADIKELNRQVLEALDRIEVEIQVRMK